MMAVSVAVGVANRVVVRVCDCGGGVVMISATAERVAVSVTVKGEW